jgi:hypothetical protein
LGLFCCGFVEGRTVKSEIEHEMCHFSPARIK